MGAKKPTASALLLRRSCGACCVVVFAVLAVLGSVDDDGGAAAGRGLFVAASSSTPTTSTCGRRTSSARSTSGNDDEQMFQIGWEEEDDKPPSRKLFGLSFTGTEEEEDEGDGDGEFELEGGSGTSLAKKRQKRRQSKPTPHRDLFSFSSEEDAVSATSTKGKERDSPSGTAAVPSSSVPHPLRTDEWRLTCRWKRRGGGDNDGGDNGRAVFLEFSDNGYVRERRGAATKTGGGGDHNQDVEDLSLSSVSFTNIGTWEITPTGVVWKLRVRSRTGNSCSDGVEEDDGEEEYEFRAGLHLNPFGAHPLFVRGIVLGGGGSDDDGEGDCGGSNGTTEGKLARSRRKRWFRPVVGTFTGIGIGRDTSDLSYSNRPYRGF